MDPLAQAKTLLDSGRPDQARALLETLLPGARTADSQRQIHRGIAVASTRMGDWTAAATHWGRCAQLDPRDPLPSIAEGESLRNTGKFEQAEAALHRALAIDPRSVAARTALAQTYYFMSRFAAAAREARAALELTPPGPQRAGLYAVEGQSLLNAGNPEEGVRLFRLAVQSAPGDHLARSGLAVASTYASGLTPEEVFRFHRDFAEIIERGTASIPKPTHRFKPGEPLAGPVRIGFLSPDFRAHATALFIRPLIEKIRPESATVFMYHSSPTEDDTTAAFRALGEFRQVTRMRGDELARTIAQDRVHVLIDLAGHTENNRIPILTLRPAPVQATYLGYPNTTAMREVDFRIADSFTEPAGAETPGTERPARLDPCFLCFRPAGDVPSNPEPPCIRTGGPITFGVFSALPKLSDELLAAWARLMRELDGATMIIKHVGLKHEEAREYVRSRLSAAGIDAARVTLEGPVIGSAAFMTNYDRIDIALDTYPYNGTTTICEALDMGVPMVSWRGRVAASRVGWSLLEAVGLGDLVATDADGYIARAVALASDRPRLRELKTTLRARFRASPICDAESMASRLTTWAADAYTAWAFGSPSGAGA